MRLHFIDPDKPVQNAYIYPDSVNGRLRDECLNEQWSMTLPAARSIVEALRDDHNAVRPDSALGNRTPNEFAEQMASKTPAGF